MVSVDGQAVADQAGLFSDMGEVGFIAAADLFGQQDGAVIVSKD